MRASSAPRFKRLKTRSKAEAALDNTTKFAEKPSSIFDVQAPGKETTIKTAISPRLVLDTNTVLDWLVFKDPAIAPIAQAVEQGFVAWMACSSMREEFARTLGYDNLRRWNPDPAHALAVFDRLAVLNPRPPTLPLLRCSDPDDQVFLDLAVATSCQVLLTHDRALLRLARRAAPLGVRIMRPRDWPAP